MGFAELVKDVRQADSSVGGSVPEDAMATLVDKISHRLVGRTRQRVRKTRRSVIKAKLRAVHEFAFKDVGGSVFQSAMSKSSRVTTKNEAKLILSASTRIAEWAKRSDMRVEDIFHSIDTDGSGSIDYDEVRCLQRERARKGGTLFAVERVVGF
jgi:hypothetical protein